MRTTRALAHAAEVDRKYRPTLEERLEATLASDVGDDDRTWLAAVLAGSQAASGDPSAFEASMLAGATAAGDVLAMEMTLEDVGHLPLRRRVLDRARELSPDAPGPLGAAAGVASAAGDRAGARALFERLTTLRPLDHSSWHGLGQHLLLELDPAAHDMLDKAIAMSGAALRYQTLAAVGLSKLLRGQRDEGRRLVLCARGLAC